MSNSLPNPLAGPPVVGGGNGVCGRPSAPSDCVDSEPGSPLRWVTLGGCPARGSIVGSPVCRLEHEQFSRVSRVIHRMHRPMHTKS